VTDFVHLDDMFVMFPPAIVQGWRNPLK